MEQSGRLVGALWGHLVGDAVGVPYEFKPAAAITTVTFRGGGMHNQPAGTWSDDGALMLALLDSLLRERTPGEDRFDTADQAKRSLAWADAGAYTPDGDGRFDIGGTTWQALDRVRTRVPAEEAGGVGEHDNGNGSLMRILPIALVERDLPTDDLVDHAQRASAVTHGHPLSQASCALYVLIVRNLIDGSARAPALADARKALRASYSARPDAAVRLNALDALEAWTGRSGRGYVIDSLWSAWDAFAGAKSYRDTIERAVRYGHDTDTTACIAGGMAGARFGLGAIPTDWLGGMRGKPIVEPLLARLTGSKGPQVAGAAAAKPPPIPAGARTSDNSPIRVDWVDFSLTPSIPAPKGKLGMTFLPGKKDVGSAGRHWRDADLDVKRLREHHEVDTFVLLVEDHELAALEVPDAVEVMQGYRIDVVRHPIVDMDVPADPVQLRQVIADVADRIGQGRNVVVACRGGLGRTGTFVAVVLRYLGVDAPAAIAATRAARKGAIQTTGQEAFATDWSSGPDRAEGLPFTNYRGGGRRRLGKPRQGNATARSGYGPPVFEQCGYECVYCGLDMRATFESWLQLSVDHVVPAQMARRGYPADLVEDVTNLVTCCRACNDFGNRFTVQDPPPTSDDAFYDIRDRVFRERKAAIRAKREQERSIYQRLPAAGPDRPPPAGEPA